MRVRSAEKRYQIVITLHFNTERETLDPLKSKTKLSLASRKTEFDPKCIISEFTFSIPWNPLTLNVRNCAAVISKNIIHNKWNGDNLKTPQKGGNELQYVFYNKDENSLRIILCKIWKHELIDSLE